jgi:exodeoxyribonuclease VII large subunit
LSLIANSYLEVDKLKERLNFAIKTKLNREKKNIEHLNNLLIAYNPTKVIEKGYAIIEDDENNIIISKNQLNEEKKLNIILKDGKVKGNFIPLK